MSEFKEPNPPGFSGPWDERDADGNALARPSARTLLYAAEVVENTAFEKAADYPAAVIGLLINLSAELYRTADTMQSGLRNGSENVEDTADGDEG